VVEERLAFLQKEFDRFDYMINPYHIQPGLLLDVDICSIKRKKATLDGMANVLNEFLHGVSKGFQDAAFASFSRRRSTVREDIAQSFAPSENLSESSAGSDYLAMLNTSESPVMAESATPPVPVSVKSPSRARASKPRGVVDASGRGSKAKAKPAAKATSAKRARGSKGEDGGLRQL
jgi:hypothetical protein